MLKVLLILSIAPAFGYSPPVERHVREVRSVYACVKLGARFLKEHAPSGINAKALSFTCEVQDGGRRS